MDYIVLLVWSIVVLLLGVHIGTDTKQFKDGETVARAVEQCEASLPRDRNYVAVITDKPEVE